jgi:hypothetical protein
MGRFIVVTYTRRDQPPAEGNTATPPRYSREPGRRRAPEIRSLPPWRWRAAGITKYPIIGSISAMSLRPWGRYQFATPSDSRQRSASGLRGAARSCVTRRRAVAAASTGPWIPRTTRRPWWATSLGRTRRGSHFSTNVLTTEPEAFSVAHVTMLRRGHWWSHRLQVGEVGAEACEAHRRHSQCGVAETIAPSSC